MHSNKSSTRRFTQWPSLLTVIRSGQIITYLALFGHLLCLLIQSNPVEGLQRSPNSGLQLEQVLGDRRAIYFNPNPSTRSQNSLREYLHSPALDKPEDWSFFKSLLTARNNQNASTKLETTPKPKTTAAVSTTSAPTSTTPPESNTTLAPIESEAETEFSSLAATTTTTTTVPSTSRESTTTTELPSSTTETLETDYRDTGSSVLTGPLDRNLTVDPLFSKQIHRSIQEAVNRIVKTSDEAKNKVRPTSQPSARYSNSTTAKGSLSLNVLLRNFGIHNLTNLDQILLRSSLRNETSSYRRKSNVSDDNDFLEDQRSAECRIEYTVKHVNLSLMNAAQGDYTCDYSIDRRLVADKSHKEQAKRVCRLQLTSAFFSNRSTTSCPDSHISVDALKFCHLQYSSDQSHEIGLNRTFDFPLTRDSFEVKVVHRERADVALDKASHIQLEIKPLTNCWETKTVGDKSQQARLVEHKPSSTTTTTSTTTSTTTTTTTTTTTARPSTTSKPPARAPISTTPRQNRQSSKLLKKAKLQTVKEEETLCDGTIHSAFQGQIKTPDYPNLYAANISCYFEFAPTSPDYCSILLQFRDFDLISHTKRRVASDEECREDYLQIGRTLYCNRYAMIGHKMQLPLTTAGKPLRIYFRTNNMQAGRGFLAKYQQLPCSVQAQREPLMKPGVVYDTTTLSSQQVVEESFVSTHEPPLQKPDFDTLASTSTRMPKLKAQENKTTAAAQPLEASTSSLVASLLPGQNCGTLEGDLSFFLRSPGHPNNYPSNLECLYYVRRNATQICYLELTYLEFDLEPDTSCRYDYLEVNGVRLCGSLKELQHKTTRIYGFDEPIKLIKFKSDSSGSRTGFLIRAEQLPCSEGSILRQSKAFEPKPSQLSQLNQTHTTGKLSRTIQYDFATTSSIEPPPQPLEDRYLVPSSNTANCDRILLGREVIIRSPYWPESYSTDDTLTSCRYKIYRDQSANNRICQLELRFVHLHLGTSDCIDVDGHELLCGFNTRNLVSYYPFESQTQLTITFLTGLARLAGRSMPATRSSDLLPGRAANKFMIIAKQHECVDGFLAPQVPISDTVSPINETVSSVISRIKPNLMYSLLTSRNRSSELSCPELVVQKKDELRSLGYPDGYPRGICRLQVVAESSKYCQLELEFLDLELESSAASADSLSEFLLNPEEQCTANYLQLGPTGKRLCKISQLVGRRIRLPFHPLSRSLNMILHLDQASRHQRGFLAKMRQIECGATREDHNLQQLVTTCNRRLSQPIGLISSAGLRGPRVCRLDLQLLPGFCRIQLSFTMFDLGPRAGLEERCAVDYLELEGERYCGQELANVTRILRPAKALERTLTLNYWPSVETSGFRATFRQIECEPEPLRVLSHRNPVSSLAAADRSPLLVTTEPPLSSVDQGSRTEFKEILIRDELFELDSRQLSRPTKDATSLASNRTLTYEPNQFIVFRIRKSSPATCGLKLLFYRLDLEPSSGCKRDFLDINGLDRICGQLDPSGSEVFPLGRVYSWSTVERDFLISFVSDQLEERSGFFIIGQQLNSCPSQQPAAQNVAPPLAIGVGLGSKLEDETHTRAPPAIQEPPALTASPAPCHRLISETEFHVSSPSWPHRYQRGVRCHYLVERSGPNICSLNIRLMSLVLGAHEISQAAECLAGEDRLLLDGKPVCGQTGSPYALSLNFSGRTFIELSFRGPQGAGLGFHLEGRQEKCASVGPLAPEHHFVASSPPEALNSSSPVHQPDPARTTSTLLSAAMEPAVTRNQCGGYLGPDEDLLQSTGDASGDECVVVVRRANESVCGLDMAVERFQLEPPDRLSKRCQTEYLELDGSRICGGYPAGHRLRFGFELGQLEKVIRFRASRLALRLSQRTQCGAPEPDTERDTIGYLPSSEHRLANASSTADSPEPSGTLCQFVHQRRRQFIISPNYSHGASGAQSNVHCLYRILAASYDFCSVRFQLTDLELDYSKECHTDYLLIDQQRFCGAALNQTVEMAFPESLPREIQLVYHTGGSRFQSRRGFRLLYEQIPCDTLASSTSTTTDQDRQARRANFGQLSYPRNYVSDASARASPAAADAGHDGSMRPNEAATQPPADELKLNKEIVVAPGHRASR